MSDLLFCVAILKKKKSLNFVYVDNIPHSSFISHFGATFVLVSSFQSFQNAAGEISTTTKEKDVPIFNSNFDSNVNIPPPPPPSPSPPKTEPSAKW